MWKANGRTDGRRTLTHDKSSHGLWPGELKNWRNGNDSKQPYWVEHDFLDLVETSSLTFQVQARNNTSIACWCKGKMVVLKKKKHAIRFNHHSVMCHHFLFYYVIKYEIYKNIAWKKRSKRFIYICKVEILPVSSSHSFKPYVNILLCKKTSLNANY